VEAAGVKSTVAGGFTLWHDVESVGAGVASNVARLVALYAERAALRDVPPITLSGPGWDAPWETVSGLEGCSGNSGPSDEELRQGVEPYTCLVVALPTADRRPLLGGPLEWLCRDTVDGVIAHEVTHLRWPRLRHGPEFYARTLALLRGATWPERGGWKRTTQDLMQQTRTEVEREYRRFAERLEARVAQNAR